MITVSVIIPTFKGSKNIGRALNSLVNQLYKEFEVIVVDDNGINTEEQKSTEEEISKFQDKLEIKYLVHERNKNGAAARNTGLNVVSGKYICFLDDDDVYLKNRIKNAVEELENKQEVDLCFCSVIIQRRKRLINIIKAKYLSQPQNALMLNHTLFATGSNIFLRKKALDKVQGFNETYLRFQDIEFLLRVFDYFEYTIIDSIDIAKCNSGIGNIPRLDRLKQTSLIFQKDFEDMLDKLDDIEINTYKQNEAINEFISCLGRENKRTINIVKKELEKYRKLSITEKVSICLSSIGSEKRNLYIFFQPTLARFKNLKNHLNLINMLDKENIEELKELGVI